MSKKYCEYCGSKIDSHDCEERDFLTIEEAKEKGYFVLVCDWLEDTYSYETNEGRTLIYKDQKVVEDAKRVFVHKEEDTYRYETEKGETLIYKNKKVIENVESAGVLEFEDGFYYYIDGEGIMVKLLN